MSSLIMLLDYLRERPRLLRGIFLGILGAIILYDFTAERPDPVHFTGDRIRMFWLCFALGGTILMTKIMKGLAVMFIAQPPGFYGDPAEEEE